MARRIPGDGRVTVSERRSIDSAIDTSRGIGADRLADRGEAVTAQQFGELLIGCGCGRKTGGGVL